MSLELDPVLNAILDLQLPDPPFAETEETDDVFAKLFSDAKLDAAIGSAGFSATLEKQVAHIHEAADKLLKRERSMVPAWPAPASDREPVIERDLELNKAFTGHSERKRASYRYWISEQLALGKTVGELSSYARRLNPEVADLIDEIGSELEAA